ncbi:MAG: CvpA family protein [Candidatus Omnitrophota bacterium]
MDIILIAVAAGILIFSFRNGLLLECYNCLAVLLTAFLCIHFYQSFGEYLNDRLPASLEASSEMAAFYLIWAAAAGTTWLIGRGMTVLLKQDDMGKTLRISALLPGFLKALALTVLIVSAAMMNAHPGIQDVLKGSAFARPVLRTASRAYTVLYERMILPVSPKEEKNQDFHNRVKEWIVDN